MGEVYEAEDRDLHERIAIKTLRPEISADSHNITRLFQEIQLARKVTHPNVCRVFDLARHTTPEGGEIAFLTMELLGGQTLAERLRNGRVNIKEALPIIAQICAALQAAHDAGIIHRDFKSANVMLAETAQGSRAVVMDFGLARAVGPLNASGLSMTETGRVIGTLAYMAPEQFESGFASLHSDIYALGVVMYEMATGSRPWAIEGSGLTILRRLKTAPAPPRTIASDVDALWERAILRCLAPDPAKRFDSAAEVVRAIHGHLRTQDRIRFTRRQALGAACLGGLALIAAGIRLYHWNAGIQEGSSALLTEIGNMTQDPELDAVTDLLRTQLEQSAHFSVMERSRMKQLLQQMGRPYSLAVAAPTAREMAWRGGDSLVIFGTVSSLGKGLVLNIRI
jgi:serine/threonine protein kinase